MTKPAKPDALVTVSKDSAPALAEPSFLIRVGDAYYLTLGLWKYDPKASELTREQKAGVAHVAGLFKELEPKAAVTAVPITIDMIASGGRTSPPLPPHG